MPGSMPTSILSDRQLPGMEMEVPRQYQHLRGLLERTPLVQIHSRLIPLKSGLTLKSVVDLNYPLQQQWDD